MALMLLLGLHPLRAQLFDPYYGIPYYDPTQTMMGSMMGGMAGGGMYGGGGGAEIWGNPEIQF